MPLSAPGYELLLPLGGGPMSVVYSARRPADGRVCAVKLLREDGADYETAIRLIRREARALRAAKHPHLVCLLDSHVSDPPHYLAFELLGGEPLRDRLQREYALDLRTTLWVARQIAEALHAVHQAGYVHGDIKPDNVQLIDSGTAVLLDLGFAHTPGDNAALSAAGYVLGTANYLAPELCGDDPADDAAADWFAFGVMLYELLTGSLPYELGSAAETIRRHREEPAMVASFGWPPRLTALIEGLLRRTPTMRPRGPMIVHELIALEIAALGLRRAG